MSSPPGPATELAGLVKAGRRFGVSVDSLRRLVDKGLVRCVSRHPHSRGESIVFNLTQLAEDLELLPRCKSAECDQPGTGKSGYCGLHFGEGGRRGAAATEKALLENERDWLKVDEAQARLGAGSRSVVMNLVKTGDLEAERVGRLWHIAKVSVEALLASGYCPVVLERPTKEDRDSNDQRIALLHDQGRTPGQIAKTCRLSKPTVYASLARTGRQRQGQGRASRWLAPEARARRKAEAVRLYTECNLSRPQIAEILDSSPSQIGRDLEAAGVKLRPRGTQTRYPAAEPRECQNESCDRIFTPEYGSFDVKRRCFCSDECARVAREASVAIAIKDHAGLLGNEVADLLGVGSRRVASLRAEGRLPGTKFCVAGAVRYGYAQSDVDAYITRRAHSRDGRSWAPLDPAGALVSARHSRQHISLIAQIGETAADIQLAAEVAERAAMYRGRGGGRPRAESTKRWLAALPLDQTVISKPLCRAIALEDWREHPEDWPVTGIRRNAAAEISRQTCAASSTGST